jgi:hypothetical protein
MENFQPGEWANVKVYASHPWGTALPGAIRRLRLEMSDMPCGLSMQYNYYCQLDVGSRGPSGPYI